MPVTTAGRYVLFDVLAKGGMATVHYGRLLGSKGFARTVAIKRLHSHLASDPVHAARFVDEALLAARIHHPNVVSIIDVISEAGEAYLVMEYVHGESLAHLLSASMSAGSTVPLDVVGAVMCGALEGLHAAHEAKSDEGTALHVVHRDVSPQNILVGADGIARVLDFGVAKATGRSQSTTDGHIKGKLAYMAPEQLQGGTVDRRTDIFAAGIVLWETLTCRPLFGADTEGQVVANVVGLAIEPPSHSRSGLPKAIDLVVMRALQRTPAKRYPSARQMARELETCVGIASPARVAEWVDSLAGDVLRQRSLTVEQIEVRSLEQAAIARVGVESARLLVAGRPIGGSERPGAGFAPDDTDTDLPYADTIMTVSPAAHFDASNTKPAVLPLSDAASTGRESSKRGRLVAALLGAGAVVAGFVAVRAVVPHSALGSGAPEVNPPATTNASTSASPPSAPPAPASDEPEGSPPSTGVASALSVETPPSAIASKHAAPPATKRVNARPPRADAGYDKNEF
jgi:eukaryotic-like serine/threonine-protein kinase